MKCCDYDESNFDSDELRSIESSSEDENNKIGYVRPPVITKKRRRLCHWFIQPQQKGKDKVGGRNGLCKYGGFQVNGEGVWH